MRTNNPNTEPKESISFSSPPEGSEAYYYGTGELFKVEVIPAGRRYSKSIFVSTKFTGYSFRIQFKRMSNAETTMNKIEDLLAYKTVDLVTSTRRVVLKLLLGDSYIQHIGSRKPVQEILKEAGLLSPQDTDASTPYAVDTSETAVFVIPEPRIESKAKSKSEPIPSRPNFGKIVSHSYQHLVTVQEQYDERFIVYKNNCIRKIPVDNRQTAICVAMAVAEVLQGNTPSSSRVSILTLAQKVLGNSAAVNKIIADSIQQTRDAKF